MRVTPTSLLTDISQTGIPPSLVWSLKKNGIVNIAQLYEMAYRLTRTIKENPQTLRTRLIADCPDLNNLERGSCTRFHHPPLTGLAGPTDENPELAMRRKKTAIERSQLRNELQRLAVDSDLPSSMLLTPWLPDVRDQGMHGYCVGFGSTSDREFLAREILSPGWAYRGAKSMDNMPDAEGSYQAFAYEYFYKVGHVAESLYSYEDAIRNRPLWPLHVEANRLRIAGFVDLLPDLGDFAFLPSLMRAVLTGQLQSELGPRPLSVSLALYESIDSYTTRRTGLMTLPLPEERMQGGHAMVIVGYIDGKDPQGLYETDYFIVRNSWGKDWAQDNPLQLPGHALIPAAYFTKPERVWELLFCIAEPSPALNQGSLGGAIRALRRVLQ